MRTAHGFTHSFQEDALCLKVAAPRRAPVVAFTAVWLGGWALVMALLALDIVRYPDRELESNVLLLGFWTVAGAPVAFVLLWMAGGQREEIRVTSAGVAITRRAGPLARTRRLDPFAIRGVAIRPPRRRALRELAPVGRFWRGELGRVVIHTASGRHAFGEHLPDDEVLDVVSLIESRLPVGRASVPHPFPGPGARLLNLASAGSAALAATVLVWPVVSVPFRLAVTDRSICFFDDSVPPITPVDVSGLRPDRRVYIVPLDGVTPETAGHVAAHFRAQFGLPIEVGSGRFTLNAYDPARRQVNAVAVLEGLQERYRSPKAVAIAITTEDMYIPGFRWRYAFSYRRGGRLAVVSTARMDRGCLGLFAATGERRLSRLRKMVGKNIGVLYYGLPLTADPRSLLYANIGGPQELDAMSERF